MKFPHVILSERSESKDLEREDSSTALGMTRLGKHLSRILSDQHGYSLVELIVASVIFIIIITVATASFVSVTTSANKATAKRTVQQDARYNLEGVARQVRASAIDYNFYKATSDPRCSIANGNMLALLFTEAGAGNAPQTKRLIVYFDSNQQALFQYVSTDATITPTCSEVLADTNNSKLTAGNVRVTAASFLVAPTQDPSDAASLDVAKATHPRVTITMTVATQAQAAQGVIERSKTDQLTIATTVSTRAYPVSALVGQGGTGAQVVWSAKGTDYIGCGLCQPDADGQSIYQLGNYTVTYITNQPLPTTPITNGLYALTITYKNSTPPGLPVPNGYTAYNVTLRVTPGAPPPVSYNLVLPVAPPGTSPRTFTQTGIQLSSAVNTLSLEWTNDQGDANFAITKLELTK